MVLPAVAEARVSEEGATLASSPMVIHGVLRITVDRLS